MIRPHRPFAALAVLAAAFAAAGCATQVTLPPLPECHPANPDAAATPLARPSGLLDATAPMPAGDAEAMADHEEHAAASYTCPMHPEVRSDVPGTCPVCGMALEEIAAEDEGGDDEEEEPPPRQHQHPPGGGR